MFEVISFIRACIIGGHVSRVDMYSAGQVLQRTYLVGIHVLWGDMSYERLCLAGRHVL